VKGPAPSLVRRARVFAAQRHAGQRRKGDGKPFITHPVAVGRILARQGMPEHVVAAGLLHDVLEDTPTPSSEIARLFGRRVASLVEEVTEPDKRHSWEYRKRAYLRHLKKASRGALSISCADKLHNTASLLAAYHREGPVVFDRFSRGIDRKAEYHREVCQAIRRAWPGCPGLSQLERLVGRLEEVSRRQMSAEPREREAKFLPRGPAVLRKIEKLKVIGRFRLKSRGLEIQENQYLDTEDFRLRQARAVLKVRRVGGKSEVTFKREIAYRGGISERIEVTGPDARLRARKITGSRPLRELLNLRTRRRTLIFGYGRERVEVDLDQVEVRRGGKPAARYSEVELENRTAREENFMELLAWIKRSFRGKLRTSRVPKVEMGLRLLKKLAVASLVLVAAPLYAAEPAVFKSTAEDQTAVEVTVYNSNLGLVKDLRKVQVPAGQGELRFMDVASSIQPVTVRVRSVNRPEDFTVLEQNYEYDLMSPQKLLDKFVGKKIKLVEWKQFQDRKETVEATLLSTNNGEIYQVGDEIYLGHPGVHVLPEIPENLIAKPTLMWLYDNRSDQPQELEVSYLTGGINWNADYVLVLSPDDTAADLSGWVTVTNQSGAAYRDAKLKLIAGEIHRARDQEGYGMANEMVYEKARAQAPQFQEQGFFEYHIYDLQRPTTIKENQTKQIGLLEASGAKARKEMLVYGVQSWFARRYEEQIPEQPVKVYVKLKNSAENHLGMPLPAGVVRVYKKDSQQKLQLIGEDRIKHTPKDEEVKLEIGEAFDVVAERRQTDYKQITSGVHESEWEVTLRNHKNEGVTVGLIEPLYGNWSVISNSHPFEKVDAFTIRFNVDVPKDGEVKVLYRVRVGL